MKYLIIFNPNSANGTAVKKEPVIRGLLDEAGIDYSIVHTQAPGDAILFAERAIGEYDSVIAAGGDGTANEVINGLLKAGKKMDELPFFGVFPIGRGNDFAFGAGIPKDLAAVAAGLAEWTPRPMDVGKITGGDYPEGRYFGNGIGIGFDTVVGLEAAKITWAQGFLSYLLGALKTMFLFYNAPLLKVEKETNVFERSLLQISVMNGTRMGGAFYMAPDAVNDDGFLDLCFVGEPKRIEMLGIIVKYMKGSQRESPYVEFDRASKLKVSSPESGLVIHADGETICTQGSEVDIECIPDALRVLCMNRPSVVDN